jgi:hypothetical protein
MSIDGYLGSATSQRLELSNQDDLRPGRRRPRLLRRDPGWCGDRAQRQPATAGALQGRRDERTVRGLAPSPIEVTVTERVELDPCADFFTAGQTEKLDYCASPRVVDARSRLGSVAVRERWPLPPGTPGGERRSPRSGRSATWCCCATRSRLGSRATDRPDQVLRPLPSIGAHLLASQSGCSLADDFTQPESDQHKYARWRSDPRAA